jgi:hypothetical protein
VPRQEEGEIIATLVFTGPQANRHHASPSGGQGKGSHRTGSRLAPKEHISSRRIGARASRCTVALDQPLDPSPFRWFTVLLDQSPQWGMWATEPPLH